MSTENNIVFDESKYKIKSRVIPGRAEVPGMIKFLLDKGIVKTEKSAHVFLVGITGLFFVIAICVFAVSVFDIKLGDSNAATAEELQQNKERFEQIKKQRDNRNNQNTQQ